ncbi:MAG TPA: plastocyanin/azurin family copper-binding protein [Gemmatimonadaceae bacterium]|nr:plastocyanin/azurin family copper-binding protein [Gemmatimonadaceae bacterium]
MSHNLRSLSIALSLAAALACGSITGSYGGGGGGGGGPPPPPPATVEARPTLVFTPGNLTITAGETMTFSFGSVGHDVTFDNRVAATPADIPGANANKSVQRTFAVAGVYQYHCNIHPGMAGTVTVQ